ncbi:hypothetical protein BegalDRAFT_1483 [Beggiatoa alba B18LD]|uniref:Uncharacterized protein n=1 Tax=Beggiatoa alba B18LD TaxID=395493 RepID=I3CFH7_9GAMM|nr:hypothetical protein [Beggiatoa alba]EIJ42370.1 hypothetical protein BegalDRAFT_1483 [Beggiatoa alba B18LD]
MQLEQADWVGGLPIKGKMDERLEELEQVIEKELSAFYRVGNALVEIRDKRLYRLKGYENFEAYCVEVWKMHRQHAHRLINASAVVRNLSSVGDMPKNEAQVRPLVGLPPEKQREVWETVCQSGKVTAERVQAVLAVEVDPLVKAQAVYQSWGERCEQVKELIQSRRDDEVLVNIRPKLEKILRLLDEVDRVLCPNKGFK